MNFLNLLHRRPATLAGHSHGVTLRAVIVVCRAGDNLANEQSRVLGSGASRRRWRVSSLSPSLAHLSCVFGDIGILPWADSGACRTLRPRLGKQGAARLGGPERRTPGRSGSHFACFRRFAESPTMTSTSSRGSRCAATSPRGQAATAPGRAARRHGALRGSPPPRPRKVRRPLTVAARIRPGRAPAAELSTRCSDPLCGALRGRSGASWWTDTAARFSTRRTDLRVRLEGRHVTVTLPCATP